MTVTNLQLLAICKTRLQIPAFTIPCFTDSGFYNSVFYRFRLLQFRVLQIPAFTIPGFTDSGFYNSVFYRFRLLQFRVLQIPAFTIPCFTDSGFYNSVFYRFRLLQFRVFVFLIPFLDSSFRVLQIALSQMLPLFPSHLRYFLLKFTPDDRHKIPICKQIFVCLVKYWSNLTGNISDFII